MRYDKEYWKVRKLVEELLLRWEPRTRSDVLKDVDILDSLLSASEANRVRMIRKLKRDTEFWPYAGYPQH